MLIRTAPRAFRSHQQEGVFSGEDLASLNLNEVPLDTTNAPAAPDADPGSKLNDGFSISGLPRTSTELCKTF